MATTKQTRNSGSGRSLTRTVVEHSALFSGGLNTEVSDTIDAIPYTSDECNCDIRTNGTRSRRLGIDYERDYALLNYATEDEKEDTDKWAFNLTEWVDVKDRPGEHYIVLQTGLKLFFFKNDGAPYSNPIEMTKDGKSPYYVDVSQYVLEEYRQLNDGETEYKVVEGKPNWTVAEECKQSALRFTEAYGNLFVCGRYIQPFCMRGLEAPEAGVVISGETQASAVLDVRSHWSNKSARQYYTERSFQLGSHAEYTSSAFICYEQEDNATFDSLYGHESGNRGDYLNDYKMISGLIGVFDAQGALLGWLDYDHRAFEWYDPSGEVKDGRRGSFKVMEGAPVAFTKRYIGSGSMEIDYPADHVVTYIKSLTIGGVTYSYNDIKKEKNGIKLKAIDDFGNVYTPAGQPRVPTANYYARLWNALPEDVTKGVVCSAKTPFTGDRTNDNASENGTPEYLIFKTPNAALEGFKIRMREVYKTNKNSKRWFGRDLKEAALLGYLRYSKTLGLSLKIRDFEGVLDIQDYTIEGDTQKDVDFRHGNYVAKCPQQNTQEHKYNLHNQGWTQDQIEAFYNDVDVEERIGYKGYPANNMQWFVAKKDFDGTDSTSVRKFKPAELLNTYFGGVIAPRGHFILDYFDQNRERVSGFEISEASLAETSKPRFNYVTDIAAYAGRIFYLVGDTVLYSQVIVEDFSKADKCYQEADPTSETLSDLVDTDGGMIVLSEIGTGIRFVVAGGALGVVGNRATAIIGGGSENVFTATAYTAATLMTVGSTSPDSFVNTEEGLFYWAITGIARLATGANGVSYEIISKNTIQTLYDNIPESCIRKCQAVYDKPLKQIIWMYPDEDDLSKLVNFLKLDIQTGRWTRYKIVSERRIGDRQGDDTDTRDSSSPYVVSAISLEESYKAQNEYYLYATDNSANKPVVNDEGQYIITEEPLPTEKVLYSSVLYLIKDVSQSSVTFGNFNNNNYQDWAKADLSGDGYDYESYLVSHPILLQQEYYSKTTPYLLATFRRTEQGFDLLGNGIHPSACQGSIMWDWPENGNSGKWDAQQELYRYDKGSILDGKMVSSKTRVYGSGRALQIRLSSVGNKGFIIENVGLDVYVDRRI